MPLERQTQRVLQMLAAGAVADRPPPSVASIRESMAQWARAMDPRALPPVHSEDLALAGPAGALTLRRYVAQAPTAAPLDGAALLYLHGGIGVFGNLATHDAICRQLCLEAGTEVFALEYRLAPEHPYPAAHDDTLCAARWLLTQAGALGLDPQRVAIGGDSAGATLATVACRVLRDAAQGLPAAQLLLCPVTDLTAQTASRRELAHGYFPPAALLAWALDLYCPPPCDRTDPLLSPLHASDLRGLPPAIVHTAEYDPFRDEGAAYAAALAAAGVPVHHVCHPGLVHHYIGMTGLVPAARAALAAAARELRALLAAPAPRAGAAAA